MTQSTVPDRVPPQSLEAEQATLGAMMLEREAIGRAAELLSGEAFYREAHGLLFRRIVELETAGSPVDLVTLGQHLREHGDLDQVGGMAYLMSLMEAAPTAANIDRYAATVHRCWVKRGVIQLAARLERSGYEAEDIDLLMAEVQAGVDELAQAAHTGGSQTVGEVAAEIYQRMERIHREGKSVVGLRSGWPRLDRALGGFEPGMLVVIGALPGGGKTTIATNLLTCVARMEKVPVLMVSIEQPAFQLATKSIAIETGIEPWRLRSARLTDDEWPAVADAVDGLGKLPLRIHYAAGVPVERLIQVIRGEAKRAGVRVVAVDFLQNVTTAKRCPSEREELKHIVLSLKDCAGRCNVAIILTSQFARESGHVVWRQGSPPCAAPLRAYKGAGEIEATADFAATLNHELDEDDHPTGHAILFVGKNRQGAAGYKIDLHWFEQRQLFVEAADDDREEDAPPGREDSRREL